MAVRVAIVGVDRVQRDWLAAAGRLRAEGEIEIVGVGHRTAALAKDIAEAVGGDGAGGIGAYDDLRLMINERGPQVLVVDRPANMSAELLKACVVQKMGVLSLGPPVETMAEAVALTEALEGRGGGLLQIWPRFTETWGFKKAVEAEDFVRPIRFASGRWLGMNHVMARVAGSGAGPGDLSGGVRSLTVLAWDALSTLIELIDVPETVYASVRGTVGSRDTFADLTGMASLTLRFAEDTGGSLTISDRMPVGVMPGGERSLLLFGQGGGEGGTARLAAETYGYYTEEGGVKDEGTTAGATGGTALESFREFLRQYAMPAAAAGRGSDLRLEAVAATMEALVVSHRTGQAESPEKFRRLRR